MSTVGATSVPRSRSRTRKTQQQVPEGTMEVLRVNYDGSEANTVETVQVPKFEGPVGYQRVEGSVTRNMGNFNSVRVAVMLELPCYPVQSEIDRCYAYASQQVDEKIRSELQLAVPPEDTPDQAG